MLHTFPPFPVTNVTQVNVVVKTFCTEVIVCEDPQVVGYPTTDYLVYGVALDAAAFRRVAGHEWKFRGAFKPGDIAGSLKTVTGTTDFVQAEQ